MAVDWLSSEVASEAVRQEEPPLHVPGLALRLLLPALVPALRSTGPVAEEELPAWQEPAAQCPS